jgi:hypothetical protein
MMIRRSTQLLGGNCVRAASSQPAMHVPDNSYAFSGSGWLMPFHVGAIRVLKAEGLINSESHYSGSSGGAICALHACADKLSDDETLELIIKMSKDEKVWHHMDEALRLSLAEVANVDTLKLCQGRLHVTTTKVWPNRKPDLQIFSQYDSVDHLIDCVAASSFIPMYSATKLSVPIRGTDARYFDGGVLALIPPIGKVTIAPFGNEHFPRLKPYKWRHIDIGLRKEDYSLAQLVYRALKPLPEGQMRDLHAKAVISAEQFLERRVQECQHNNVFVKV